MIEKKYRVLGLQNFMIDTVINIPNTVFVQKKSIITWCTNIKIQVCFDILKNRIKQASPIISRYDQKMTCRNKD